MSRFGGEVGDMRKLLSSVKEAHKDFLNSKSVSSKVVKDRKEEKKRQGDVFSAKDMSRNKPRTVDYEEVLETMGESSDAAVKLR